ncbi:hypothetical protein AcW1_000833 [Taiwanofungus camphoratus]|nr:hypothetical protein AcW2_000664 [Antrodia cinnamomea]KAI0961867.1 hypothetical protein AcV7_000852 [Antrodia cinnamomea]KAI0963876.1 hypothetical protein AcW1_000833 [Antrodia cinnamomea]
MAAHACARCPSIIWRCLSVALCLLSVVSAQSSTTNSSATSASASASSTPTPAPSTSLSLTTSYVTIATTIHSGNQNYSLATVVPVSTYNVTVTATSSASTTTNSSTASPSATPITLDTRIDPAFGVLGALLIITGLPSAFLGHKNRWTSFFLIGCYTLALVCFVLILRFGILQAVNPPTKTVRGLFVLACGVAGIAGGGIAIFFWRGTKYFVGAWGGFVLALWIQSFRDGGLIRTIGLRWIMYICIGAAGFIMCTVPKMHYHILLVSTAFVGATAFILGIDCYTTGGLKEFYIWNLGFMTLFPKFTNNGIEFPISQTMEIEMGLIGAVSLMGIAVQFQILKVLQHKLKEIKVESKRRHDEAEERAAQAFIDLEREKEEWEREHPTLLKHGRNESGLSASPLLREKDDAGTPVDERRSSGFTFVGTPRQRYQSGVSDFMAAAPPLEELNRSASRILQSPGALPVLDLGVDIENDVPQDYMADSDELKGSRNGKDKAVTVAELEALKHKEDLLAEIQTIRKSIDILKAETPDPSSSSESRHPSFTSRRTLSYDLSTLSPPAPSHLRPPRQVDPRARVQSMELSNISRSSFLGEGLGRPTSAPLQEEDWDSYVRDRKLLQPPSGVTPPIATTPLSPMPRVPVSPAVEEALLLRQRRESALSFNQLDRTTPERTSSQLLDSFAVPKAPSSDDVPVALRTQRHAKSGSQGSNIPVTILPPRRPVGSPPPQQPDKPPRTRTFEELAERHREKIRELQEPLTRAEKEQVDIQEAKRRWERAKALEKEAVAKRQAEKAAAYSKEAGKQRKSGDNADSSRKKSTTLNEASSKPGHSRSLSADILAAVPGNGSSSKRMSTMKVEDWQKHQQSVESSVRPEQQRSPRHKPAVPFPEAQDPPVDSRQGRRMSGLPRDPPN